MANFWDILMPGSNFTNARLSMFYYCTNIVFKKLRIIVWEVQEWIGKVHCFRDISGRFAFTNKNVDQNDEQEANLGSCWLLTK